MKARSLLFVALLALAGEVPAGITCCAPDDFSGIVTPATCNAYASCEEE